MEADQGSTKNSLIGGQYHRVVRAVLLPNDSGTNVLITGIETRNDEHGRTFKTLRIDNRAKGNGGLVWASMSEAATYLWYAAKDWQEKHAAPK